MSMLKDVIQKIDHAIPSLFPVDPKQFNDPVAELTEWKQVRSAKTARASNKLIQADPDQLVYKPSMAGRVFGIVFILMGAIPVALYLSTLFGDESATVTSSGDPIIIALVGLVFMGVGVLMILLATSPVVFNKKLGMFYRGRKQKNNPDATGSKNALKFSDIHAIQLLTRLESSQNKDQVRPRFYKVHDLNLVKHDGQRLYITTYMKPDQAITDATTIGAFVNVPVWDGSDSGPLISI